VRLQSLAVRRAGCTLEAFALEGCEFLVQVTEHPPPHQQIMRPYDVAEKIYTLGNWGQQGLRAQIQGEALLEQQALGIAPNRKPLPVCASSLSRHRPS
jgi:hypothetical protein